MRRTNRCLLAVPAVIGLLSASFARADNILVYQSQNNDPFNGDTAGPAAAAILTGLGHNVTSDISIGATLPADLSSFDSIWVIQLVPITGVQQTALADFVRGGGGLYLTGERPCCEPVNAGNQFLLNELTPDVTQIGNQGEGGDLFTAGNDTWSITTTPNAVPTWLTGEAGLMDMIPAINQVYNHANGKTGAAAWAGEELNKGAGCVYIAMDLSWWFPAIHPEQDKSLITENIQTFLGGCADSDDDGLTDVGEDAAGTNPADPDSDDDGLCDGYGAVDGVCVPGESIYDDTDNDGMINPLDDDDDGDGIPTAYEVGAEEAAPNVDDDSIPAWLDLDSDNNNIPDSVEGEHDYDNDGIPSIVDTGDNPENCDADEDCIPFGQICDLRSGFCADDSPSEGGGNQGGSGPGGSSGDGGNGNTGGSPTSPSGGNGNTGGDDNSSGSGNSNTDGDSGSDDGCDCSVFVPASPAKSAGYAALFAMLLLGRRRARRPVS
jgi:hypothetical protein